MPIDRKKFLTQLSKELHRPVTRKFKRAQVITKGIDDVWSADLADMNDLKEDNDGYRYILTVIDVFSRYAWAVPIKTKDGDTVLNAFKKITTESKRMPKRLWVDQGKEFVNKKMEKWLKENDISLYHTFGEHKASTIERFNRTLKSLMWRRFTQEQTHHWIDMVPELLEEYNNRKHSTIKMTPIEASKKKNEDALWKFQYGDVQDKETEEAPADKPSDLQVGDWVRISKVKRTFEKGYTAGWSKEIFQINEKAWTNPITFKLQDWKNEMIKGSFYAQELQRTMLNDTFLVDEVLEHRTIKGVKQSLVSWIGYPKDATSWIDDTEIEDI
jgi:hypothetical protein